MNSGGTGLSDVQVLRAYCDHSLLNFTRHFFRITRSAGFVVNSHHLRICEALEEVLDGKCSRLIINMPPRYGKSLLVVINFIAYCFGRNPACEFIHLSKSATLVTTNARQIAEIMNTQEYRRIYPGTRLTRANQNSLETSAFGKLYCAPFDGQILGHGAGRVDRPGQDAGEFYGAIIIDDPHKAQDVFSEAGRTAATYYAPEEFTFLRGSASVEEISLWDTEAEEYIMVPSELWDCVRKRIANIKDW